MIITIIGTSFLFSFLDQVLNTSVKGFSIFIIVPIGAMLFGFLAVSGMAIGRRISKARIRKFYILTAMIAGFLAFFVSMGVDYWKFRQETQSKFYAQIKENVGELSEEDKNNAEKLFNEKINFSTYFKDIYENTTVSISSRRGRKSTEINDPIMSIFSFWSTVIGSAIGGMILAKVDIGERTKNAKTKRYQDLKFKKNFDFSEFQNAKSIIEGKDPVGQFIEYVSSRNSEESKNENKSHIVLRVLSDRIEGIGEIVVEKVEVISSNDSKTNREKLSVDVSSEGISKIVQSLKDIGLKEKF